MCVRVWCVLCAVFHPMKTKSLANYANSLCEIKTPTEVAIRQLINTNRSWSHETSTTTYRIIRQMLEIEIDICHSINELIVDPMNVLSSDVRDIRSMSKYVYDSFLLFGTSRSAIKTLDTNNLSSSPSFAWDSCELGDKVANDEDEWEDDERREVFVRSAYCETNEIRFWVVLSVRCAMSAQSQSQIMIVWIACDNGRCRICVEEN